VPVGLKEGGCAKRGEGGVQNFGERTMCFSWLRAQKRWEGLMGAGCNLERVPPKRVIIRKKKEEMRGGRHLASEVTVG